MYFSSTVIVISTTCRCVKIVSSALNRKLTVASFVQDVWAEQELTRMRVRDGEIRAPVVDHEDDGSETKGYIPDIPEGRRTEYRLSLDFEIDLFQTAAGFTEYLAWMTFNNTTPISREDDKARRRRIDEFELPEDILKSKPPFDTRLPVEGLPAEKGWKDVVMGVNTVEMKVWPLFHVTGDKIYRDSWWSRVWFTGHARSLLNDAIKPPAEEGPPVIAVVDGVRYVAADTSSIKSIRPSSRRGGGWSDTGDRYEWQDLCGPWEQDEGLFIS